MQAAVDRGGGMERKSYDNLAFDFEVGELKQSPCKTCSDWAEASRLRSKM
jgi:hypothetical protein